MSDEEKPKSWWYTLPGIITSLAGTVTALAAMVVAILNIDWPRICDLLRPKPDQDHRVVAPAAGSCPVPLLATCPVPLPLLHDYTLDDAKFTLLKAELSPKTTAKETLTIWLRMTEYTAVTFPVTHSGCLSEECRWRP